MHSVGGQLKVWRKTSGHQQDEAAALLGLSPSTYQNYERDTRAPNTAGWEAFARAGINTNWLLTGEGPMLISELSTMARVDMLVAERNELAVSLQKALEKAWASPAVPQSPRINVDVLASLIEGLLRTAPNAPPAKLAGVCASLYQDLIDKEMITPEGVGTGNQANAA